MNQQWRAQLVQSGEGQLHLRLDTRSPRRGAVRRPLRQVPQQNRLAGTRFAVHHQRPALASANSVQQPVKHLTLSTAIRQFRLANLRGETTGHLHGTNAIPRPLLVHLL